ncbi:MULTISPECIES: class I SAM-dependent methyltransferase [unclassified Micromonospora]|uniref:class I SAM-dependent methyltransferase n=1 Tax=unclassified Micromonospora TaxID=2617518 RepID=UPI001C23F286|nr:MULTISPECIES: class I SAM-dependent methyltransferase [unclassified Micromonospora]MBU8861557.1 class I SAM-dependent methyltransferase [Micromonospora sp. WMMB482]MDM4781125.1 class I SAM-dependent methyltransferase [Micromonospora sp. b486]
MLAPADVAWWRRDWETVMRYYQPGRDEFLAAGLAAVQEMHGRSAERVLDVGGGPGTTAEAVLRWWPDAHVTVLDVDPVLLALTGTALPHVRTVRADIATEQWVASAGGPYDVLLALMTVHYLTADRVRDWYAEARQLLRPGGLLLVGDVMRDASTVLTAQPADGGADPWTAWWSRLGGKPAMAPLLRERAAALTGLSCAEFTAPVDWHRDAARRAGFPDVTVLHRRADHALMAFRRPGDGR